MYIYIHLLMNSPHVIDQILNFYKSYLVENLPFLIHLAFVMHVIFILRIFGFTDSCNFCLVTYIHELLSGFDGIIKLFLNFC